MKKIIVMTAAMMVGCFFAGNVSAIPYPNLGDGQPEIVLDGNEHSDIWVSGTGKTWRDMGNGDIMSPWQNAWVEYEFDLVAGAWDIGLNATNFRSLGTDWYDSFQVSAVLRNAGDVFTSEMLYIPASETQINHDYFSVALEEGDAGIYTVQYTWLNDKYAPSLGLDANLQITAAFAHDPPAPIPEPSTLLLLGAGLLGVVGLRRKK
jgi:hypothetical protein